ILYISMFLSLLLLSLINFVIAWYIVGLCALFVFVFALSNGGALDPVENKDKKEIKSVGLSKRKIFRPSFIFVILALLFVILSGGRESLAIDSQRVVDG